MHDVSYSPAFKWFLILLVPITLAWKLTVPGRVPIESATTKAVEMLVRQHFNVALVKGAPWEPALRATSGACRILVTNASPIAWERTFTSNHATSDDDVFVVFGGRIYSQHPTWLTVTNFLWFRLRHELGFNVQPTPILTVVANKNCQAERLPWKELSHRWIQEVGALMRISYRRSVMLSPENSSVRPLFC